MSNRNNDNLTRFNIFKNNKGQNIYFDKRSKTAYVIQESDFKRVQMFSSRPFVALAIGILLYGFASVNIFICMGITVVVFIALEYYFRNVFLAGFPRTQNLDGVIIKEMKDVRKSQPKNVLLIRIIGYWGCSIGIIILTYKSDYQLMEKVLIYGFTLYAIYNGCLNLIAFINSDEKNK